ncbi:sensor histidine kinase [Clostridium tetani]|nr:sensor histidine kinase [Clostridium tetani]RXI60790.1 sensor histidine kinase [Clostridium tetani]RXI61283.1 sensor histidine kinase [Clostridium tetani]RXI66888.1 sensor histidine kinase [Clostridium tetani]RXM54005.1 sensor histidine kinase [Clostridium tetani]RXM79814.1 sensor histidine kinase [Clostridium tetani]
MKLFLKDNLGMIILYIINFIVLAFFYNKLGGFKENMSYFIFLSLFFLMCFLVYKYILNKQIYKKLSEKPKSMDDMLTIDPHSPLEEAFFKTIQEYMKLYNKDINFMKNSQKEYKIMLNNWVHQMKTPVSVINLLAQNNYDNEDFQKVALENRRIDYNLSQILTFLRIDDFANDMKIEKVNLKIVALEVVNELKEFFITQSVFPKLSISQNLSINTDKKWIKYAIYQIVNNAIKYSKKNGTVYINGFVEEDMVVLEIINRGIGIKKSDINRIFDVFFTGDNGRTFGESTGVGLYIVKKVLDILDHKISVKSKPGEETIFYIYFKP